MPTENIHATSIINATDEMTDHQRYCSIIYIFEHIQDKAYKERIADNLKKRVEGKI